MDNTSPSYEVRQVAAQPLPVIQADAIERAAVDTQVATAKQYPRDITRAINNSIAIATMDLATAQSCSYALPRGGKPITGPSVHLAKLIVSNWGNMRIEAKVIGVTDRQVVSKGTCWDLENNVAASFEVRRSIIGRGGQRFSDDMITVTGNAANSIAFRNAVFAVIPKAVTDRVYQAAQHAVTGDLSDQDMLLARRKKCIDFFREEYAISEQEVIALCGKQTVNQIKAPEIALLLGITQSLADGDTTVDELMRPFRKQTVAQTVMQKAAEKAAQDKAANKKKEAAK